MKPGSMRRLVHDVIEVHNVIAVQDVTATHDEIAVHDGSQLRELRPGLKADKCQYATFQDSQNSPTISLAPP
jgi:hypothetical protein